MRILLAAAAASLLLFGCGTEDTAPEPSDGKVRPPPNGVRTTETAACSALSKAHSDTLLAVGCVGTSQSCPALLRSQSGADCLEYDQGSLDGCIDHIKSQMACADVAKAISECVVYAYEGSSPAGCP